MLCDATVAQFALARRGTTNEKDALDFGCVAGALSKLFRDVKQRRKYG
jgi:hypothetical protein